MHQVVQNKKQPISKIDSTPLKRGSTFQTATHTREIPQIGQAFKQVTDNLEAKRGGTFQTPSHQTATHTREIP